MSKTRRFNSIWASDRAVDLEVHQPFNGGREGTHLEFDSPPPAELVAAFDAFKPEVLKLLSLPKAWGEDVRIIQVAIKYKPDGDLKGISISFVKPIADSNAPFAPTLPFLPAPSEDGSFGMSGRMMACLEELEAQATALVERPRAQLELLEEEAA